jgi:ABC-type uncharacterized transport system substrate-binding protein
LEKERAPSIRTSIKHSGSAHLVNALREGLNEAGFVEGQNIAIEYRWADDHPDRLAALAADLVRRQMAVIVTNAASVQAVKAITTRVPIVFISDPAHRFSPKRPRSKQARWQSSLRPRTQSSGTLD